MEGFIGNPIVSLALGIILTIWGTKMTAPTHANAALIGAWLLFGVALYRTPMILQQSIVPRGLTMMACAGVAGLAMYWSLWTATASLPPPPALAPPPAQAPVVGVPFSVQIPVAFLEREAFWIIYDSPRTPQPAKYAADVALFFRITNLKPASALVTSFAVYAKTDRSDWITLTRLPLIAGVAANVYGGTGNLLPADRNQWLERIIGPTPLTPHQPASGWMFFQFPAAYKRSPTDKLLFRVEIRDAAGTSFMSEIINVLSDRNELSLVPITVGPKRPGFDKLLSRRFQP